MIGCNTRILSIIQYFLLCTHKKNYIYIIFMPLIKEKNVIFKFLIFLRRNFLR
ncbi:hypothetical protein GLOIN_2v1511262 [Rhizophagus irregularis DAOM 181602=DAOM 197198]|uniref:Uncharacterized protein n=1 Tax=Rhizophagus irregularis (strain DAOM 181602 / DAOM 197198 / MUCL 43194) TaxID=747089 RepID=A0A2P4QU80_RHIID|nr:hypothetical protein GLOIN_2v1511262 [Rhizophagus irregularis DAOM 181602=DAOM 197198]POG81172.1 hypothetical protein GLOIN_2v1511262 [Rhizophagus irregularis DAOM 181602=DAOM 197198]|eukprot:XP_025188038.1 hypothetical protein GLOIN_2v1511262 [Rhizophagus irregularis DAOM 181602=DAOM 197198]